MNTIKCTCQEAPPHRITCPATAVMHRNAMMCPDGSVLYPDNPDDAKMMMELHDARYVFGDGDVWVYGDNGEALT